MIITKPTTVAAVLSSSHRAQAIPSFMVMDILRDALHREAAGLPVYHLEAGQPCFAPPQSVLTTIQQAIQTQILGYTESKGARPLREALAQHYSDSYGQGVSPANIVITNGSSAGFVLAFLSAFDAGARVGVAVPGYPAYRHIINALGMTPVSIIADATTQYKVTIEALEQALPLAGVMIASPANPTGVMLTPEELKVIAEWCHARGVRLLSDEIYHGITYGAVPAATALAYNPDAIVINSFSKYYAMTGWRVGWMVVPDALISAVEALAQSLYIAAPSASQVGAVAALQSRLALDEYVAMYAHNREVLLSALPNMGLMRFAEPDGAFYLYIDMSDFTRDAVGFCRELLHKTGIALTPGVDFDAKHGHATIRLSYACSEERLREALGLLSQYTSKM
jgi:aspartate/methionine/tyrosine aminotransferase